MSLVAIYWSWPRKWEPELKCHIDPYEDSTARIDENHYFIAYQTSLDAFEEKIKKRMRECNEIDQLKDLKSEIE